MTLVILGGMIGLAGPVSAAPGSWVMPNVRDMVLRQALKEIGEVTSGAKLSFRIVDKKNGQEVINEANWLVCAQHPRAGSPISKKSKRINMYVKRFNQSSCT